MTTQEHWPFLSLLVSKDSSLEQASILVNSSSLNLFQSQTEHQVLRFLLFFFFLLQQKYFTRAHFSIQISADWIVFKVLTWMLEGGQCYLSLNRSLLSKQGPQTKHNRFAKSGWKTHYISSGACDTYTGLTIIRKQRPSCLSGEKGSNEIQGRSLHPLVLAYSHIHWEV